jgi:hypothetical protein
MQTPSYPAIEEFLADFEREAPPLIRRSQLRTLGFPLSPQTLSNLATAKEGPPFYKVSGRVVYRRADLVAFLRSRTVKAL